MLAFQLAATPRSPADWEGSLDQWLDGASPLSSFGVKRPGKLFRRLRCRTLRCQFASLAHLRNGMTRKCRFELTA